MCAYTCVCMCMCAYTCSQCSKIWGYPGPYLWFNEGANTLNLKDGELNLLFSLCRYVWMSHVTYTMCCSVLQCVAVCCSLCVAVCCSVLQCVAVCCRCVWISHVTNTMCCSVLQCVAVCCRVLQCVAVCCRCVWMSHVTYTMCCSVLQCVADMYKWVISHTQCVAVCCSVLQRVAACVLQCVMGRNTWSSLFAGQIGINASCHMYISL